MKFFCRNCGAKITKSIDTGEPNPDVMGRPWYTDERGENHLAMMCLHCGTIHDTKPSLLKMALFFLGISPLKTYGVLLPEAIALKALSFQRPLDVAEYYGFPEVMLHALADRKILGPAFSGPAQGTPLK